MLEKWIKVKGDKRITERGRRVLEEFGDELFSSVATVTKVIYP